MFHFLEDSLKMKTKTITLRVFYAAVLGMSANAAVAQVPDNDGYLFDTRGVVARSGYGLCWQTTRWTPAKAIAECDPDLVKKPDAPKAVAAVPVPAPAPAPAAPPPPKKCDFAESLASDATFAFGKSALTAGAKKQLDVVAAKAGGCASISSIAVTGHTDRIGSAKGNQALSERRAAAVKAYLEGKGVKAASFTAAGVANTQSMANVNCAGKMPQKKLVACLAPDRRVVVDVQGLAK
jgi:OOP family OmpA-OmpF porin